jgi:hypothetical protein
VEGPHTQGSLLRAGMRDHKIGDAEAEELEPVRLSTYQNGKTENGSFEISHKGWTISVRRLTHHDRAPVPA